MTNEEVVELYRRCGALKDGHFRLSSGLHSDRYFQSALTLANPTFAARLGAALAVNWRPLNIDCVLGPAVGAIVIGHEVARALSCDAMFAERVDGSLTLRRGFQIDEGDRVLLIEDVITTGGTLIELAKLVRARGGNVAGCGCLIDRRGPASGEEQELVGLRSLARLQVNAWEPELCPECKNGRPLDVPGSRHLTTPRPRPVLKNGAGAG